MARIAGVDLPKKKRIEYGLTYIFGIGLKSSRDILTKTGISFDKRVYELTEDEVATIRKEIQASYMVEGDLRKQVAMDIKGLMELGSYRGLRFVDKKLKQTQEQEKAEKRLSVRLKGLGYGKKKSN